MNYEPNILHWYTDQKLNLYHVNNLKYMLYIELLMC